MTFLHAIAGTLAILAFHVWLTIVLAGVGLGARRIFGQAVVRIDDVFTGFWCGFGLVLAFLLFWAFAWPVGTAAFLVVCTAGATGFTWQARAVVAAVRAEAMSVRLRWVLGAFAVWVANVSAGAMTYWDTALYHMQGVEWARTYAVVPGLANLLGPLGFNNASWLYDAMLDVGPWRHHAWHVANGLLVTIFALEVLVAVHRVRAARGARLVVAVLTAGLLPLTVNYALAGRVSSFSTAVPAALLLMVMTCRLCALVVDETQAPREDAYTGFALAVIGAAAVAVKISAGIFVAAALTLAAGTLIRRLRRSRALLVKCGAWASCAILAIAVGWTGRSLILTGYPAFPLWVGGLAVDWKVPVEHARAEYDYVRHTALNTADNLAFVSGADAPAITWIRHWVRTSLNDVYLIALPGVIILGGAAILLLRRSRVAAARALMAPTGGLLAVQGLAVLGWGLTAPMPRYGAPFFWGLAATIAAQVMLSTSLTDAVRRRFMGVSIAVGLSPILVTPAWLAMQLGSDVTSAVVASTVKMPDAGRWFQFGRPDEPFTIFTTTSGLRLVVPSGERRRCWDLPLPCTHNPSPALRLRVEGHIERGFTVDGRWAMRDWPQPARSGLLPALRRAWQRQGWVPPPGSAAPSPSADR